MKRVTSSTKKLYRYVGPVERRSSYDWTEDGYVYKGNPIERYAHSKKQAAMLIKRAYLKDKNVNLDNMPLYRLVMPVQEVPEDEYKEEVVPADNPSTNVPQDVEKSEEQLRLF